MLGVIAAITDEDFTTHLPIGTLACYDRERTGSTSGALSANPSDILTLRDWQVSSFPRAHVCTRSGEDAAWLQAARRAWRQGRWPKLSLPLDWSTRTRDLGFCMLRKIISGGQTGADRAGLDFALQAGL